MITIKACRSYSAVIGCWIVDCRLNGRSACFTERGGREATAQCVMLCVTALLIDAGLADTEIDAENLYFSSVRLAWYGTDGWPVSHPWRLMARHLEALSLA